VPNRNDAPFELKEWKLGFEETDYYGPFSRKTSYRQGPNRCKRHHYCLLKACGDGGKTTTPEPLILLEFKHFYEFFSFSKNSENYHQKDLKSSIRIKVVI
jgi:hypothetical protein